jgi:hypothetical protein
MYNLMTTITLFEGRGQGDKGRRRQGGINNSKWDVPFNVKPLVVRQEHELGFSTLLTGKSRLPALCQWEP